MHCPRTNRHCGVECGRFDDPQFFRLPTGLMTVDSVGAFSSWSRIKVEHETRAIIDEISMVRSDDLSAIDIRLHQAAGGEMKRR